MAKKGRVKPGGTKDMRLQKNRKKRGRKQSNNPRSKPKRR